jgi:hypothetical protein
MVDYVIGDKVVYKNNFYTVIRQNEYSVQIQGDNKPFWVNKNQLQGKVSKVIASDIKPVTAQSVKPVVPEQQKVHTTEHYVIAELNKNGDIDYGSFTDFTLLDQAKATVAKEVTDTPGVVYAIYKRIIVAKAESTVNFKED